MNRIKRPLNWSIIIVSTLFFGLLCIVLSLVTYRLYTRNMYDRYEKQTASIADYVQSYLDNDDMAECADTFVESEKYKQYQEFLDHFIDYYEDVHYVYIMKVSDPDDPIQIYEVVTGNSTYEKENEPDMVLHLGDGQEDWYDAETAGKFREILYGNKDVYIVNESEWGTDYTLARPLVNSQGVHYGLLCVDISIDQINDTVYRSMYINIAVIIMSGVAFIVLLILWMQKNVTEPIKKLENSVVEFAQASTGRRNPDELVYHAPEFHMENEVESLTNAITKLSEDMRDYVKNMLAAEKEAKGLQEHVTEMNEIAYRDALTHVKNKAAYEEKREYLAWDIVNGCAEFGIVMMDLNSLKFINDRYGHERGDEYLMGACHIISDVYTHSPVYRIGGDEFVVVLQGRDYESRDQLLTEAREAFSRSLQERDMPPWNRYSAAVGMAVWEPGDEVDTVFKRADQNMYEIKSQMKAGSAEPDIR